MDIETGQATLADAKKAGDAWMAADADAPPAATAALRPLTG